MSKDLRSNIWKYAVFSIANKRVFIAILGAYYLSTPGVTPKGVGIILLAGSLANFIFEIPSGYVSDKIGHKQALVISRVFVLFSTVFFLLANSISFLILAAALMSIGHAFHSGTGSAFMHETLKGLRREQDYASVMGKIGAIGFAVPIALTVAVPFLVSVSFKLPFVVSLVVDLVGLAAAVSLIAPPVPLEHIKEIGVTNFKKVIQEGHQLKFFSFALFSGIVAGTLLGVGGFRAPYQTFLAIPVIWYGIFFGLGRALASLMIAYSGKIKTSASIFSFYKFQLILYSILILALGAISNQWVVVLLFLLLNAFQWGLSKAEDSYLIEIIKTSKFKATLLSTESQISQAVAAVVGFGIGFMVERLSYQLSFLYLGIIFVIVLLPLYLYIIREHRVNVVEK